MVYPLKKDEVQNMIFVDNIEQNNETFYLLGIVGPSSKHGVEQRQARKMGPTQQVEQSGGRPLNELDLDSKDDFGVALRWNEMPL